MTLWRLILLSLWHHRRVHGATALAVAAATAVLTGALVVGDSMRASLRQLALTRLGRVEYVLQSPGFFRAALAEELSANDGYAARFAPAVPAILVEGSLERASGGPARANRLQVIACDARCAALGWRDPVESFGPRDIALDAEVARQLAVAEGDDVLLRLPQSTTIPRDSALGRKRDAVVTVRARVARVLDAAAPAAQFALRSNQRAARNVFMRLDAVQGLIDQPARANALLVPGHAGRLPDGVASSSDEGPWLQAALRPRPADVGLRVEPLPDRGFLDVSSERMVLPSSTVAAVRQASHGEIETAFTYLANRMALGARSISYSTITAVDFADAPPLGPWRDTQGRVIAPLKGDQLVLNAWAAEQLEARVGDRIEITYFAPDDTTHERTHAFTLVAIVPMTLPAADRRWTPAVPGVTDQRTMADWDAPFPFERSRVLPADEAYWDDFGPTPKAFVALATGQKLWGSRFGEVTSLRIVPRDAGRGNAAPSNASGQTSSVNGKTGGAAADAETAEPTNDVAAAAAALDAGLAEQAAALGLVFQPVRAQALAASVGTTPFEALFLGFSMFIIAAAGILVALVFRLSAERRAAELGILAALGFTPARVRRWMLGEALAVAALGGAIGAPLGVAYAALMLLGLRTWWSGAVHFSLLELAVRPRALLVGLLGGLLVAMAGMWGTLRRARRVPPRRLLAGEFMSVAASRFRRPWLLAATAILSLVGAMALALAARGQQGEAQVGAFFGAGSLVLLGGLAALTAVLRSASGGAAIRPGRSDLLRLAWRNAARHPLRSASTMALVALAVFLIVAISAFHVASSSATSERSSGTGGFAVYGEASQPFYDSPATAAGRNELGFPPTVDAALSSVELLTLRARPGDDASCLNLYQPRRPRVVGLSPAFIARGGFAWTATAAPADPWRALQGPVENDADGTPLVPVVLEQATANYSLHLWQGIGERFSIADDNGREIRFVVVGLLGPSIFQGDLLVSEEQLLRCFPEVAGYRIVLAEDTSAAATPVETVAEALETGLGNFGLIAESTGTRLARFLSVQNTYLSTFQSLGGLGLLLGTLALAAVQLRNVWERRRELALLAAIGFRPGRLIALVMVESLWLLAGGMAVGLAAAAVALLPQDRASLPWSSTAWTVLLVFAVGAAASAWAAWRLPQQSLVTELRRE